MASETLKSPNSIVPRLCLVCNTRVHNSNKVSHCQICLGYVHFRCADSDPDSFHCCPCLTNVLSFLSIMDDDDFYSAVGVTNFQMKTLISNFGNKKLNLNPYNNIDDNLINNPDIDVDFNHFDSILINDYYDSDQLNKILKGHSEQSNIVQSIMHVNTCSLISHVDSLYASLQLLNNKFSIIGITETWTNQFNENLAVLPGYDSLIKSRVGKAGGGIAIYIDSELNLNIKQRTDLCCASPSIMETLFIQIPQEKTKDIICGVVYRPPGTSVNEFLMELEIILDKISLESKPCYIMGDFNIDLLNNNPGSQSFLNQLFLHGFYPRVDRPTRISSNGRGTSSTLIDNIFTNVHSTELSSGIWIADIADHLPVYTILPNSSGRYSKSRYSHTDYVYKRIYNQDNIENFKTDLLTTDWTEVYNAIGTQAKYTCFDKIITKLVSSNFPEKRFESKASQTTKPWITTSILNSIRKKIHFTNHF